MQYSGRLISPAVAYSSPATPFTFSTWLQQPVATGTLFTVRPSHTNRVIFDVAPDGDLRGFGDHVVGIPTNPNGELWVHMTGTGGKPYLPNANRFLNVTWDSELMGEGYTVLDVAYDNEIAVNDTCSTPAGRATDNAAGDLRLEVLVGGDHSVFRHVGVFNSVQFRVRALINYLIKNHVPMPIADASEFEWANVGVSGHSQGAGHAYYVAKYFGAKRACFLGGPFDVADWVPVIPPPEEAIADWYLDTSTNMTPISRMGAFLTTADDSYDPFVAAYGVIGLTKDVEWFDVTKLVYHDERGLVIDGHAASIQDPSLASYRAQAAFR